MHTLAGYMVVFVGAGIGGAMRHGINVAFRGLGADFLYGTLFINIVGSLMMGLLAGLFAFKVDLGQSWRLFLTTGLLGGFTTYSTFLLEAVVLYERGELGSMAVGCDRLSSLVHWWPVRWPQALEQDGSA